MIFQDEETKATIYHRQTSRFLPEPAIYPMLSPTAHAPSIRQIQNNTFSHTEGFTMRTIPLIALKMRSAGKKRDIMNQKVRVPHPNLSTR